MENGNGRIRLACDSCDRVDHDGIDEIPEDWIDVLEYPSEDKAPSRYFFRMWFTHIGTCPTCAAQIARAVAARV